MRIKRNEQTVLAHFVYIYNEATKIRIMAEHTTYLLGPYRWFLNDYTFCSLDTVLPIGLSKLEVSRPHVSTVSYKFSLKCNLKFKSLNSHFIISHMTSCQQKISTTICVDTVSFLQKKVLPNRNDLKGHNTTIWPIQFCAISRKAACRQQRQYFYGRVVKSSL